MTDAEFMEAWEVIASPALKQLVAKLRYMGRQYAAGQYARGGGQQKHYLEEAADELDRLFELTVERAQEIADLRNVVQVAAIDGLPGLDRAWRKYFPEKPIKIKGLDASGVTPTAWMTDETPPKFTTHASIALLWERQGRVITPLFARAPGVGDKHGN